MNSTAEHHPVAVVIPFYNQAAYLREAVASVFAQSHPVRECVIVDDGSTEAGVDPLLKDLESQGCRILRQENQGLSAARNAGVRATTSDCFIPLDADDRLNPLFVQEMVPVLQRSPKAAFIYCDVLYFGARQGSWQASDFDSRRLLLNNLCTATGVIRRAHFDQVGGYRENLRQGYEDWDLWLRLVAQGWEGVRVPQVLFEYRQHQRSMRTDAEAVHEQLLRTLIELQPEQFCEGLGMPISQGVEAIFDQQQAAVRVDEIMRSNSWKYIERFGLSPRGLVSLQPTEQLEQIRQSAGFQMMRYLKRLSLLRWFSRNRWGAAAERDPFR